MSFFSIVLTFILIGLIVSTIFTLSKLIKSPQRKCSNFIKIERDNFIPISLSTIKWNLQQITNEQQSQLNTLFEAIEKYIHLKYHKFSRDLLSSFEFFDPATSEYFSHLTSEEIEKQEIKFLELFEEGMKKANYTPLSQKDLEFALSEEYLFTFPINMDWRKLDSSIFKRYYEQKSKALDDSFSEIHQKIWIYKRGTGLDQTADRFLSAKLDMLVILVISKIWYWVSSFFKESNIVPSSPSNSIPSEESWTPRSGEYIQRITLENTLSFSFQGIIKFFQTIVLQEPTFKELIILYRLKAFSKEEQRLLQNRVKNFMGPSRTVSQNPNAIYIKTFRDVPMADLETIYPEKTISMKPNDILKFCLTGCMGIISLLMRDHEDSLLVLISLSSFFILAAKAIWDYRRSIQLYDQALQAAIFERCLDNHNGALFFLIEQLKLQETKEAILAYFFLWKEKNSLTSNQIDELCESFLTSIQSADYKEKVDFEISDALDKLIQLGIVLQEGSKYKALSLQEAVQIIEKKTLF